MQRILVIRFGSLGDLLVLCWSLARLAQLPGSGERRVTLVTKQAFADLAAHITGVDEVIPLTGSGVGQLCNLAGRLRKTKWDHVIDAHNILRSHGLLALLGRWPDSRLVKDTFARLALVRWKKPSPKLERSLRDRCDALFSRLFEEFEATAVQPPMAVTETVPSEPVLGVAPGAMWPTKRWPDTHFTELLELFRARSSAEIRIFLGPREASWFGTSPLAKFAEADPETTIWQDRSLVAVAAGLAECTAVLTNDSGLMHLSEAVGTPVLALFGPTVKEFGYYPSLDTSTTCEVDLDCRPCSRTGSRPCERDDLACLSNIAPDHILELVLTMPGWPSPTAGEDSRA